MIRLTGLMELEDQEPRALAFASGAQSIVIGRDESADFQIPISSVSRQHARIEQSESFYTIQDLGSQHGTIVNGNKLAKDEKKVLRDGDVIELSQARITFHIESETSDAAEPEDDTVALAQAAVKKIFSNQDESAFFKVLTGPAEGLRLVMEEPLTEWTLGRSKECELALDDSDVSRRHATVTRDWRGYTIHDLGSKNGVQVNDQRVDVSRLLRNEDEIKLGAVKLVFVDPNASLTEGFHLPGYEVESPAGAPDPESEEGSVVGEPDEADSAPPGEQEAGGGEPLDEDEEGYSQVDESLLATEKPPSRLQWVPIAILAALAVLILAFVLLVLI